MPKLNLKINGIKYINENENDYPLIKTVINTVKSINDSFNGIIGRPIYFNIKIKNPENIYISVTHRGKVLNLGNAYKELLDNSGVASSMITNAILSHYTGNDAFIAVNPFVRKEEKRKLIV